MFPIALLFTTCAWQGKQTFCGSNADCGAGRECYKLSSKDDEGVCVANWSIALQLKDMPSVLGPSSAVEATATLTLTADSQTVPQTVDVLVGGIPAGTLAFSSQNGLGVTYSGTFAGPPGLDGRTEVVASVAHGTIDEKRSEPIATTVDTVPPQIANVTATCDRTPCTRDGQITVTATVTDSHLESVALSLDVDGHSQSVPMTNSGSGTSYSGQAPLHTWPFPFFAHTVAVAVTAKDAVENLGTGTASVGVTRLRWVYDAGAAVTSPAVKIDGTLVVGVSATTDQLRGIDPATGSQAWAWTV